ncbi:H-NS histone family protein [Massilia sp. CCM 8695]|uniref:H-NS histone family protein n=1 Tax=Massilia frigida TaxID=2609281 RepID=A0ABX0ND59_9BURK|nr:H-NS histone family protein [Massilia frigida]NHZ83387.1 H-NS histone family protein [Massilia frigida]CUI05485.1 DNA-binding protein, H-NS family [Janthinobacterium sp. CG23_2]CUU29271.1 DNA-binding protein, H-NS family [Janthinobacterium sp. CG23_2]
MKLSQLSIADLTALRDQIGVEIRTRENDAIEKARAEITAIAASVGIPIGELMGKSGKMPVKNKAPVKYRNPADPSKEWTGRGRSPAWVKDLEVAGKLDSARV